MIFRKFLLLLPILTTISCGLLKLSNKNDTLDKNDVENEKTGIAYKKTDQLNDEEKEALIGRKSQVSHDVQVENYIATFARIAMKEMRVYNIPASITLAQGILESGAGQSTLSLKSNNHFGIKCHKNWSGDSVKHDDDKEKECFRKYDDPKRSYEDHSKFLTTRKRYTTLFSLEKSDYKSWAIGLKLAGYATDPTYPEKLINIIENYKLYLFDEIVLRESDIYTKDSKKNTSLPLKVTTDLPPNNVPNKDISLENQEKSKANTKKSDSISQSVQQKIKNEKLKERKIIVERRKNFITHIVKQGETLYAISRKYKVSIESIIKLNHIKNNAIFFSQELIIKPKNAVQEK